MDWFARLRKDTLDGTLCPNFHRRVKRGTIEKHYLPRRMARYALVATELKSELLKLVLNFVQARNAKVLRRQ